jgi:hypothetical protein
MARDLSPKDIQILKKLAPELDNPLCFGSGHEFRSVLPPVSNHFAADEQDFLARIQRLTPGELAYITDLILDGSESLGCMPPEDVEMLVGHIGETLSPETAQKIITIYESGGECEH